MLPRQSSLVNWLAMVVMSGDKQPAPKDHPWRTMDNKDHVGNAMDCSYQWHISGCSKEVRSGSKEHPK
ncbi:CFF_collapsed_G0054490.mRNA.1.CDS.1 [Saccharomyces cerevisiae]|nr:CFF_collapsed_G0054490.mRNA.1.CDS.1 [Saccharomyces cerevisiae]